MTELEQFRAVEAGCSKLGYRWWPEKPFDLFIGSIRSPEVTNLFDERTFVAYVDGNGQARVESFKATTEPGRQTMDHPTRPEGTATVVPGQLRRIWERGSHKGKYPCLSPTAASDIPVWRGTDRSRVWHDSSGIQMHHAFGASRVDWYSAGCQVLEFELDLKRVLFLYDEQVRRGHGRTVSYTMFLKSEVPQLAASMGMP